MTSLDTASALYEDTVKGSEQSSVALASALEKRAREVRDAASAEKASQTSDEVRNELNIALEGKSVDDAQSEIKKTADHLDTAAKDIRSSMDANVTMKELPGGVAGQAQLGTDNVWIDHDSIRARDGGRLIDTGIASDIAVHEEEHTKQSASADQEGIAINGQQFDAREVREAAAISVQNETKFLSAEYQKITASLPMDNEDRNLVRAGKFVELEQRKNGGTIAMAA
ncbi:MAG: hypothetical protein O3A80_00490 [bacterium]|nr:hypothetical protein [bacterium]